MADAARIDGVRPLGFLFRVLIPLSGNTIGALWVIQFVYAWNQYVWPRVIIRREEAQVIQVGLKAIVGTAEGIQWGQVMAGTLLTLIPPLLVFLLLFGAADERCRLQYWKIKDRSKRSYYSCKTAAQKRGCWSD